jgi:hypothetical protein
LEQETEQKIVNAVYRAWADLAKLLARKSLTHREGVQLFREWYGANGIPLTLAKLTGSAVVPPDAWQFVSQITPEQLEEALEIVGTEETFEAFLRSLPEPSPEVRELILGAINMLLPQLRNLVMENAGQLPYNRGGHPKSFTVEEAHKIREEIKRRRGPTVKLADIFEALAELHGVSETTIKRVWLDGKRGSDNAPGTGQDTVK